MHRVIRGHFRRMVPECAESSADVEVPTIDNTSTGGEVLGTINITVNRPEMSA